MVDVHPGVRGDEPALTYPAPDVVVTRTELDELAPMDRAGLVLKVFPKYVRVHA